MENILRNLQKLCSGSQWGYHLQGPAAAEPAALASLALLAYRDRAAAHHTARWLKNIQADDGSVGVVEGQPSPAWPTSLAILAWSALESASGKNEFEGPLSRAVRWSLATRGKTAPQQDHIGHNTTLTGWSWANDTHSWLEPTCMFVLALNAAGLGSHARTREGVRLIADRLLPEGGANYGNTIVLGQPLLPHVQPTGLAMLALAREANYDTRIEKSLNYLNRELEPRTATASLCYGLIGLTSHGRRPEEAVAWIQSAFRREQERGAGCYKLALLLLASRQETNWLPGFRWNLASEFQRSASPLNLLGVTETRESS